MATPMISPVLLALQPETPKITTDAIQFTIIVGLFLLVVVVVVVFVVVVPRRLRSY